MTGTIRPVCAFFLLIACGQPPAEPAAEEILWRGEFDIGTQRIPFTFEFDGASMIVHNAQERVHGAVSKKDDSLLITFPPYDTEMRVAVHGDTAMHGFWYDRSRPGDYKIPFSAQAGAAERSPATANATVDISGDWSAKFNEGQEKEYPAIGWFTQDAHGILTGTFQTESGDRRFLEGRVVGDSMYLSSFDGSHAYLFAGRAGDARMTGEFWSGKHLHETWTASRVHDPSFRHPDSISVMTGEPVLPHNKDIDGNEIFLEDHRSLGRPMILEIMGSWCSNCTDATRMLNDVFARYHSQGLEIIAIAFERHEDPERAVSVLKRMRDMLGVQYPILYAGNTSKENVRAQLPFLAQLKGYPTFIFLDKRGRVRKVRTGFEGPGTGPRHNVYRAEIEAFIEQLLAEEQ